MDDFDQQIAAVEAANEGGETELQPGPGEQQVKTPEPVEPQADDTLELTEDDEAVGVDAEDEGGEEDQDDQGRKRRSKPAKQRIAELTARLREAERKLEGKEEPEAAKEPTPPNPEDFEYEQADPKYIEALTDYKIEKREFAQRELQKQQRQQQETVDRIQTGVSKAEAAAKAKYKDFDDRIAEAVEARGGEALPPALTIGIGLSEVGGDLIYRLATDDAASDRLEALARGGKGMEQQFAMAFGELEGEYLADSNDSDLDMSDPLDMARMMGRMRARMAGRRAPEKESPEVVVTNAPEPPKKTVKGGSGRTKPGPDTEDTKEFMKHYGRDMGL